MSDHWICMIPKEPHFMPEVRAMDEAARHLRTIAPEAEDVCVEITKDIQLHDCGSNLETIRCPSCGVELSMKWWADQIHRTEGGGIELRPITLPCGHVAASLNDLEYDSDQGFSCFKLEAMNANIGTLTSEQMKHFESVLGCPLKMIYRHI